MARRLPAAGNGIYMPRWSRDGHHLLYVRDKVVWLIDATGGPPVPILGPFSGAIDYFGYYGHVTYEDRLAWSRR